MATSLQKAGLKACSDKVIVAAKSARTLLKAIVTDFSVEPGKKYDTVTAKIHKTVAQDFVKGTQNYIKATNEIRPALIPLNKHKISADTLDDLDVLEDELSPVMGTMGTDSGEAIAAALISDVVALLSYTNAESTKQVAIDTLANFVAFRKACIDAGYTPSRTILGLLPTAYNNLISVLPASIVGEGGVINEAVIGARLGFKQVIELPEASDLDTASTHKCVGWLIPSGSIGVAGRYVAPAKGAQGDIIEAGSSTDEETGLVFGTRVTQNPGDGEVTLAHDVLYGAALMKQTIDSHANNAPGIVMLKTA